MENVRRRVAPWVVSALWLAGIPTAAAQDAYRQTVVVTAAATPVELGSVTRTLSVITREQIAELPVRSVADVLRLAASVDVRARGVNGVQSDFAVRGASFGQMLVLVDGVRLNDAQSGHHNGDIPVPVEDIERIEILHGPGSSLFGADAFGGTVNVVTRSGGDSSAVIEGGSFGYGGARGQLGIERPAFTETVSASVDRSSGFMYDRDFKTAIVRSRTRIGDRTGLSVAYLWKEFGANNFYGGNAPSREWTNQTLIAADRRLGVRAAWAFDANVSYRTHGDHFIFNQLNPALSDNRHRTHTVLASATGTKRIRGASSLTLGVESGEDWIRSTNLGDHSLTRVSGFGEWRQSFSGGRVQLDGSLRADRYTQFGGSWSPSVGAAFWPVRALRLRTSTGRAFRVPTFTERFYSDPANLARPEVGPETAWASEGGADWFLGEGWLVQTTAFHRADHDVIDWLRPTTGDRWRTYNVRDVRTQGIEIGLRKTFATTAFVQADYTALDLDAEAVTQLSKYLLDYAPHSFVAAGSLPLPGRVRVAPRLEYRRRSRSTGVFDYVVFDTRIARRFGAKYELLVDGTNLFDRKYQEIAGVPMPGAALAVSLAVGSR